MAVKTHSMEGTQSAEPFAAYGNVKVCKRLDVIRAVIGDDRFCRMESEAAKALYPEFPELALTIPVLSFNTSERAKLTFYLKLDVGKLTEDETEDLINWGAKLPEDGGFMYQQAAKLMKWT